MSLSLSKRNVKESRFTLALFLYSIRGMKSSYSDFRFYYLRAKARKAQRDISQRFRMAAFHVGYHS